MIILSGYEIIKNANTLSARPPNMFVDAVHEPSEIGQSGNAFEICYNVTCITHDGRLRSFELTRNTMFLRSK